MLLGKNIKINLKDQEGNTPLILAAMNGYAGIVQTLMGKGADVNAANKKNGDTALILAANGHRTEIVRALIEKGSGVIVDMQNDDGQTALMHAAKWGYTDIVRLLIEKGAALDLKNKEGHTALMLAEEKGRRDIVQLLQETAEQRRLQALQRSKTEDTIISHIESLLKDAPEPLDAAVASGDVRKARALFDQFFWSNTIVKPEWKQVKFALLTENRPMLRFLATWGASCWKGDLEELRQITAEKYPRYATLLRQCGFSMAQIAAALPPKPKPPKCQMLPY